jgi:chemotaxis protein methyltransferase CheR
MTMAASDFRFISDLVRTHSAIVLEPGKEYLVESRLIPVARAEGLPDLAAVVSRLQSRRDPQLTTKVVEAMTTNETSWFRDQHPFDLFTRTVLPQLATARASERRLRVWCAASSSGQEPYSLAMLLQDWSLVHPGWQVGITASDLSEEMLAKARAGRYSQLEVNRGLPAAMLVRHFDKVGNQWQVKEPLRRMVDYRPLNLAVPFPPALGAFDVVFCRNVLIYFDSPTKKAILERIRRVMRPDGYLFLGGAETTLNLDDAFERVQVDRATCYRLRSGPQTHRSTP